MCYHKAVFASFHVIEHVNFKLLVFDVRARKRRSGMVDGSNKDRTFTQEAGFNSLYVCKLNYATYLSDIIEGCGFRFSSSNQKTCETVILSAAWS